ncbi:hypothetical protein Y032_0292g1594 [Ancylostoma ceylanicum]|uniref:Endonuclease/exonuclease/phosphatase domain-containing protein n=1 Tax=Ancylostoma ceylanicum TaxID=53326 RepID=A0A016S675_9BILA|nr:hypothetical protein Y032_0292g1594 [Ancylostoma ceylanicum]
MIHPRVQHSIHSHEILSPGIAVLRLRTTENATITIVICYAPNSVASEENEDNFYTVLEATVKKEKFYYRYICGDFNALVGNGSDGNWRLGRHGNEARNDNGLRLLDLMSSCFMETQSSRSPNTDVGLGKVRMDKLTQNWITSSRTEDGA